MIAPPVLITIYFNSIFSLYVFTYKFNKHIIIINEKFVFFCIFEFNKYLIYSVCFKNITLFFN